MIRENLIQTRKNIEEACKRVGRSPEEVRLIAVSKTKPVEMLMEAYKAGVRDFGENKVQELMDKHEALPGDIRWHMIGHLQRNKVKFLVGRVHLIHSVDSLRLAQEIQKEAQKKQVDVNILIEVNVAEEESKFGSTVADTLQLIQDIALLPSVHIQGLMTVAPFVEDPEDNRRIFANLRQLAVDIMRKSIDNVNMNVLSMGMTGDYLVAVEEGATCVRVGTGIFGERNMTETSHN
ncbi:MAG: YggS family pyridoxal phosphate-dependent enzyme [Acetatifactor sp.]|nr:YggS family pyridoxal phosphate-dependent enzyme [Acetatifactor sp.]